MCGALQNLNMILKFNGTIENAFIQLYFYHSPIYKTVDHKFNFINNVDIPIFVPLLTLILSLVKSGF